MADKHLVRAVLKIALIIGIFAALYLARPFFTPLAMAGLLAMLFDPIQNWLEKRGWSRTWSTTVSTLILLLIIGGILFGLGRQVATFAEDWPRIKQQVYERIEQVRSGLAGSTASQTAAGSGEERPGEGGNAEPSSSGDQQEQEQPSVGSEGETSSGNEQSSGSSGLSMSDVGTDRITQVLFGTFSLLGNFLLMLVYFVLLLSQKERLREFVLRRFTADKRADVSRAIGESVHVAMSYLWGRLLLILFLAVVYSVGFSIIGLRNAIFIGVFGAILSIIPYLGNIIAAGIALLMAVISGGDTTQLLGVAGIMSAGQLLESYILEPLVVGKKVDLNPLASVVVVVVFTMLWGTVGAIVSLPFAGIIRIVFSHVPDLRDYGFLLGEEPVKN